jgi:hypothetical protein
MSTSKKARAAIALAVLVTLAVFLPPSINVNQYKRHIAGAIGGAIGRQVTVESVTLRLLPQPGFTLDNVVVADDPAFSAEPMLRAPEVTAALRLTSLWRGRLEIARLSFKEPSLNLVRSPQGNWNIEALLMRAAQTPSAPTTRSRPEARPRFPYIESDNARINFKVGQEKKVYALTEADFALWLASENEWRTRLEARPMRTDSNLSDTGKLRVDGTLQRSARLADTPLKFRIRLENAQLGQLSTLVYGRDRGWRGKTGVTVYLSGTASNFTVNADASVEEFRRYDITPPNSLALQAHCAAQYRAGAERLGDIQCQLPAENGEVAARGSITGFPNHPRYDLGVVARDVPLSYAVAFVRRAKKDLPDDLTADGSLNAAITVRSTENGVAWSGGGSTRQFRLRSQVLDPPLEVGTVEFVLGSSAAIVVPASTHPSRSKRRSTLTARAPTPASTSQSVPNDFQLTVQPFALPLGGSRPGTAHAAFSRTGYTIDLSGSADLARLLQLATGVGMGVAAPSALASGATQLQLQIAGPWAGFPQPMVSGTAELENATVQLPGIEGPVQVTEAEVSFSPAEVRVDKLTASFQAGAITLAGWIRKPRGCGSTPGCVAEFSLHSDRIATDDLNRLLNPRLRQQPWYRRIGGASNPPPSTFANMRAAGRLTVAKLVVKGVTALNFSANVLLTPGNARLARSVADVFGGALTGDWRVDFSGATPSYSGTGALQHASLAQISDAMHDDWATGAVDAVFHVTFSGWTGSELLSSTAGSLDFHWRDGMLRHLVLNDPLSPGRKSAKRDTPGPTGPLRIKEFHGRATVRDGVFSITESRMETPDGIYLVSGTASKGRELDLKFTLNSARSYSVVGTLEAPRVETHAAPLTRTP